VRSEFLLDPDVVFLNHGSFGACPRPIFERYQAWQLELERQPVEFIARRLADLLDEARAPLADYVGADAADLVFVPNATSGVNLGARAIGLRRGDEVLTTDLEYGACDLAWASVCERVGAQYVRAPIELPLEREEDVVESLFAHANERTRAVFVSHITSETAAVLPIAAIVERARRDGLVTIVDGAHAPGQIDLDLRALGADFYSGNCHKWMCAPKGAGFLCVRPEWQEEVDGLIVSWGHGEDASYTTRNERQGTRDPSAYLAVPAAIDWMAAHDWPRVQERCRALLLDARDRLSQLDGVTPVTAPRFLAQMASLLVPTDDPETLKRRLYDDHRIEIPVFARKTKPMLRVSIGPYTEEREVDLLVGALAAQ
jgi:isopenicillin-N epimerase